MKLYHQSILLIGAILPLLGGCGKQTPSIEKKPVEVKVMTAEYSDVNTGQSFSGTIEEQDGSTLSFPIAGTVKSVAVSEGQRVHKGQLIAVLDDATFRNSYEMARATLDQASDAYNRMKILHDNNSLPEIQWVEVDSKLRQAQSSFEIAKKNVSDTRLYSPISGFISEKNVEVGNNVMPGSPVVKVVIVDNVKVVVSVPETEISKVNIGEPIEIIVPALNNQTFVGRIREKSVTANSLSRSYEVKAEISNPGNSLLPGMLCTLYLSGQGEKSSKILLPRRIVQLDSDNRSFVWTNENGKAVRKYVEVGEFVGDNVSVESGLDEGDQVVIEGQQKISDNMKITVKK
jgi:RND family efflux transporter MFP subunit